MDHAAKGKQALNEQKYEDAVTLFTAALAVSPTAPDYLIQRSTALLRSSKAQAALVDADSAVLNAQKRAKRELIVEAQLRRGCALYSLGRYGDAEFVFGIVKRMNEKHKMIATWEGKTVMALRKIPEDDARRKVTVKETPEGTEGEKHIPKTFASTSPESAAQAVVEQTPAEKIRHDWYQNTVNIYFTLLVKGVPKAKTHVDIKERSLSISFPLVSGSTYDFTAEPLFAAVIPEKCITRIMPSKIEVILTKAVEGQKWSALESKEPVTAAKADGDVEGNRASSLPSADSGPAYPTSSRSGPKDWDKVTREAQAEFRDPSKQDRDDDDDDFEGGDAANSFFKKLFKDASPDVKRAMMKSYTESNGTALSTNWEEVKQAKVETLPPDGMEAKKWEK